MHRSMLVEFSPFTSCRVANQNYYTASDLLAFLLCFYSFCHVLFAPVSVNATTCYMFVYVPSSSFRFTENKRCKEIFLRYVQKPLFMGSCSYKTNVQPVSFLSPLYRAEMCLQVLSPAQRNVNSHADIVHEHGCEGARIHERAHTRTHHMRWHS